MTSNHLIRIIAALAATVATHSTFAQLAVVVNPKNATASMTAEQVSSVFLGKTSTLPSGGTAVLADLPESNAAREQFYSKTTGKNAAQVKATWARLTFSGKAVPPKELGSSADVKKFIAANPDGIGYIEKSAVDASVKVVLSVD